MAPPRPSRARLITGAVALVATTAVAALPLLDPGPLEPVVQATAALAVLAAVVGVAGGFPAWGSVTAFVLGAELVLTLHERPAQLDGRTPLMAAGLLLAAELVTGAAELRTAGVVVPGRSVPRSVVIAATAVAAHAAVLLLTTVLALPVGRDLAVPALGAAGVAVVTAVLLGLARARARSTSA